MRSRTCSTPRKRLLWPPRRTTPSRSSSAPGRGFAGFAALPMQDVEAAAAELDRAVGDLRLSGALVNGYTSVGTLQTGRYYDDPAYEPLWERFETLGVPFYLHPRNPLPGQRRIY